VSANNSASITLTIGLIAEAIPSLNAWALTLLLLLTGMIGVTVIRGGRHSV